MFLTSNSFSMPTKLLTKRIRDDIALPLQVRKNRRNNQTSENTPPLLSAIGASCLPKPRSHHQQCDNFACLFGTHFPRVLFLRAASRLAAPPAGSAYTPSRHSPPAAQPSTHARLRAPWIGSVICYLFSVICYLLSVRPGLGGAKAVLHAMDAYQNFLALKCSS